MKRLKDGAEVLDSTPVEVPLQFRTQESMDDIIKRMVSQSLSQAAQEVGYESIEDADDFDVDDGMPKIDSPFEDPLEGVPSPGGLPPQLQVELERYIAKQVQQAKDADKDKTKPTPGTGDGAEKAVPTPKADPPAQDTP